MRKIVVVLFFMVSIQCLCQNTKSKEIDSLLTTITSLKIDTLVAECYNQISKNYIYRDSDKGIFYAKKAMLIAQKKKMEQRYWCVLP